MSDMSTNDNNDNHDNNHHTERPMTGIECPEENDVPMGRGGFVNSHKGHRRYLQMVQDKQLEYVTCKKADKMKIAWSIVRELRGLEPPARFLRKDPATGLWSDVGDKKFREKVSQALREHQPFIKAVIECNEADPEPLCTTRPTRDEHVVKMDEPLCTTRPSLNHQQPSTCGWNHDLPTMHEQQQQPSSRIYYDDHDDDYQETPAILVAESRRRAFLSTRNETNVNQVQSLPEQEDVGFNLSEFSVSQGPSFPDFDEVAASGQQGGPSRRNSSGLDGLFEILNDHRCALDNLDALTIGGGCCHNNHNEANLGAAAANAGSLDNERIDMQDPYYGGLNNNHNDNNDVHNLANHQGVALLKRASETDSDHYDESYSPTAKRCVLSRDKSEVSKKLKEAYCTIQQPEPPLQFEQQGEEQQGMESLLSALEKSFPFPDGY